MKKIFFITFFFTLCSYLNGISIIDQLTIPDNREYYENYLKNFNKLNFNKKSIIPKITDQKKINGKIHLSGIFKVNNIFYAILNGNSYAVGDNVEGYTVEFIDIYKVILENKLKKERLILKIEN